MAAGRGKLAVWIGVVAALGLAGCRERAAAEEQARPAAQRAVAEEEAKRQEALAMEHAEKVRALMVQLASAKSDVERARIRQLLEQEKARLGEVGRPRGGGPPKRSCTPGDPLCADP